MAWEAVAQAETVAKFGPLNPCLMEMLPDGDIRDQHGNEERADTPWSALDVVAELGVIGPHPPDAGSVHHPDPVRVDLLGGDPRIGDGLSEATMAYCAKGSIRCAALRSR